MINRIKKIFKPKLDKEAAIAYYNKLPDRIEVKWFRDDKFIIGEINAEGNKFCTQALSAKEFIEMVNDGLFSMYNIPLKYFDILKDKEFYPSEEHFQELNDIAIKKSTVTYRKQLARA